MINLKREIDIEVYEFKGTVLLGKERNAYLSILELARDFEGVDGETISRELLGPSTLKALGKRIFTECVSLKLLEPTGMLSETGRASLESGKVLLPHGGIWRIYIIDDPLIENQVLHIELLDDDEKKDGKKKPMGKQADLPVFDQTLFYSYVDGLPLQIENCPTTGRKLASETLRLAFSWTESESKPMIKIESKLPRVERPLDWVEDISYLDLWREMIEHGAQKEPTPDNKIQVKFESITESERRNFQKNITVPRFSFRNIGTFEPSTLDDIIIIADAQNDAQNWSEWLLWDSISGFLTPGLLKSLQERIQNKFTFEIDPTSLGTLVEKAQNSILDETSRFVLSPYDLNIWSEQ